MGLTTRDAGQTHKLLPGAVSIVEPDATDRELLASICDHEGFVLSKFVSAEELLAAPPPHPACVLLGLCLPGMSGVDCVREMERRGVGCPFIVISGCQEVSSAMDCLELGATAIMQKPWSPEKLRMCVREAVSEHARGQKLSKRYAALAGTADELSSRERRVLDMLLEGALNKQIARKLEVSERTIEVDRARIMRKFDAPNLAALVSKATELRLLSEYYFRVDTPRRRLVGAPHKATRAKTDA